MRFLILRGFSSSFFEMLLVSSVAIYWKDLKLNSDKTDLNMRKPYKIFLEELKIIKQQSSRPHIFSAAMT